MTFNLVPLTKIHFISRVSPFSFAWKMKSKTRERGERKSNKICNKRKKRKYDCSLIWYWHIEGSKNFALVFLLPVQFSPVIWNDSHRYSFNQGILSVPGIAGYKWEPARIGHFFHKKIFVHNTNSHLKTGKMGTHSSADTSPLQCFLF